MKDAHISLIIMCLAVVMLVAAMFNPMENPRAWTAMRIVFYANIVLSCYRFFRDWKAKPKD